MYDRNKIEFGQPIFFNKFEFYKLKNSYQVKLINNKDVSYEFIIKNIKNIRIEYSYENIYDVYIQSEISIMQFFRVSNTDIFFKGFKNKMFELNKLGIKSIEYKLENEEIYIHKVTRFPVAIRKFIRKKFKIIKFNKPGFKLGR